MQEHIKEIWDTQLHYFNGAHNASTSVYGFSPNELHFGYNLPKQTDLLQFWPKAQTQEDYMDLIVPLANKARKKPTTKQFEKMKEFSLIETKIGQQKRFRLEK